MKTERPIVADTMASAAHLDSDIALHIELQHCKGRWQAVIERDGRPREVTSLHQLIRWLVELSTGLERPSRGLR